MNGAVDLKPCPFCGNKVELKFRKIELNYESLAQKELLLTAQVSIQCEACNMAGASLKTGVEIDTENVELKHSFYESEGVQRLIKAWNRRAGNGRSNE